jgi:Ca2+-binding RTX toxin-like protein
LTKWPTPSIVIVLSLITAAFPANAQSPPGASGSSDYTYNFGHCAPSDHNFAGGPHAAEGEVGKGTNGNDTIASDGGNDRVYSYAGNDCIDLGTGNDFGNAGSGKDTVFGDDGTDTIIGGSGNDRLNGGRGSDTISGGYGNDRLNGGPGNDRLLGGRGDDVLTGGAGNNRMDGGPGRNRYFGGPGRDTINARNHKKDLVNCGSGKRDSARVDRIDTVRHCERVARGT